MNLMKGGRIGKVLSMVLLSTAALSSAGCGPSPSQYTVEFYRQHREEREKKLAECANDPGALRDDPLCINAKRAGAEAAFGSLKNRKPIGLMEMEDRRQREREQERQNRRAQ